MAESYANWLMRWRWPVVLGSVVVAFLLASGGRFLVFESDYRIFFSKENPQLEAFEGLQDRYTKNDSVLFVLAPRDGRVFTREVLAAVVDVTERAWQTPHSTRVDSISNFQHTFAEGDDLTVIDLVEEPQELSDAQLEEIHHIAVSEPLLVRRLISPSAHITAVNITVELPGIDQTREVPEVVVSVRELADYVRATYPGLDVYLTGIVMMNNAFPEASQLDMKQLMPLAFGAILVMVLLQLRGLTGTLGTFLIILFSVVSAMGAAGWLGIALSPPVMSAPVIILTLAVADCVHILTNWMQGMRRGDERRAAMVESLRINLMPVFLTSVTTAIGFLTLNFSDAPPFRDLGNISAMGVGAAYVFSVTFLPAFVTLLPVRVKRSENGHLTLIGRIAEFVIARQRFLLLAMGAAIIVLVACIPRNETNDVFVEYFDERVRFRTDTDFVVANLTGMYFIDYSLDSGEASGVSRPDFQAQVEELSAWLREQPEVEHVRTITDIMKRLNRNMHADDDAWYRLPGERNLAAQYLLLYEMSLPYGLDLNNQIDIRKQATRLSVALKTLSTNEVIALERRVYDWMQANTPEIVTLGASPTVMFAHIGKRNIRSMLLGTAVALVLISLLLIVALRSVHYGLMSLVPNLVPAGMAFGLWGIFDGEVGLSLSVVTAMTLGIVVDDTVHFLSKYLRARREKGLDAADAVRYAFKTVGVALWVTSVALVAGFMVLSTSAFELNAGMGLLVSIVITLALVADFLFLPALLLHYERWLNLSEKLPAVPTEGATTERASA
ncbi:MAG: MMPL family transporter, partial [Pseudomonadota bacterium]